MILTLSARGPTLDKNLTHRRQILMFKDIRRQNLDFKSDVCRRQILLSKIDPRTVRVKILYTI